MLGRDRVGRHRLALNFSVVSAAQGSREHGASFSLVSPRHRFACPSIVVYCCLSDPPRGTVIHGCFPSLPDTWRRRSELPAERAFALRRKPTDSGLCFPD